MTAIYLTRQSALLNFVLEVHFILKPNENFFIKRKLFKRRVILYQTTQTPQIQRFDLAGNPTHEPNLTRCTSKRIYCVMARIEITKF